MKLIIHYKLLLFFIPICTFGQELSISLSNYGILCIGNTESFLGEHVWNLNISNQDTSLVMRINSSNYDNYIFFDLNSQKRKFNHKEMDIELRKDNHSIYQTRFIYPKVENHGFNLEPFIYKNHSEVRGEFIGSYRVETKEDNYIIVRTKYVNQYDCWYLLKNNNVINIHTEKIENHKKNQKIIVSDIDEDGVPEFSFFHFDKKQNHKMILLIEKEKFIAVEKDNTFSYSPNTTEYSNLTKRGFLHYTLK
tara:strand:- start:2010 stop:2759 length:750 start_codon:yes stop_codon:yes gene_type:complete